MKQDVTEIEINGVSYVPKGTEQKQAEKMDGLAYCIVRTYSAGVFAGYLKSLEGKSGEVLNARRIWKWDGAASLSQLAVDGTNSPENCKFPCEVDSVTLTEVIEVLPATEKARLSIKGVPVWQK